MDRRNAIVKRRKSSIRASMGRAIEVGSLWVGAPYFRLVSLQAQFYGRRAGSRHFWDLCGCQSRWNRASDWFILR